MPTWSTIGMEITVRLLLEGRVLARAGVTKGRFGNNVDGQRPGMSRGCKVEARTAWERSWHVQGEVYGG